jgi:hypothetical protein
MPPSSKILLKKGKYVHEEGGLDQHPQKKINSKMRKKLQQTVEACW